MSGVLHITSGDIAGAALAKAGLPGEVFVWHDILYEGPRQPGWPDEETLQARARFLEQATGGGLGYDLVIRTLRAQYARLERMDRQAGIVLWFDACLFDQAMLAHILACLGRGGPGGVELLCVDAFPGLDPYDGLGQLQPEQMASVYGRRRAVTDAQMRYAGRVDRAFAVQDQAEFARLAAGSDAPLPWVPAAVARWMQERPDARTGLGRLEQLALDAIRAGNEVPARILAAVSAREAHPRYWGDTTLWARINGLAERQPPLVRIEGPTPRLPQWDGLAELSRFRILPSPVGGSGT
jgi:hypothetical protein